MISVEVYKSTILLWHFSLAFCKYFLSKDCPVYEVVAQEVEGELADLNGNYILKRDQGDKPDLDCIDG